jgi:pimeloyl-ACP methyl ester carboxylesterase
MDFNEYSARRKTVTTSFGEFAYVEGGQGPPAVFVHGLFFSGYLWRHVIDHVGDARRAIAYNLPAHGYSRVANDQDLALAANARMLEAFCDALSLDRIDLVANDTGGAIAQVFTVRNPDRVRTLTLTNCEARDVLPSPHEAAQMLFSLAVNRELAPLGLKVLEDHDMARAMFAPALEHPERLTGDDIRGYYEYQCASLERSREIERFVVSIDKDQLVAIEPQLRKLEVPTLPVWGTADPIFDLELAYWLRDTIPGCREVVEVPGGKLLWPSERPEELVPHLRRLWGVDGKRARAAV